MREHVIEKRFPCNLCDKSFVLNWRLQKHIKGHQDENVKFCHFFNNSKRCIFEETSGCMFRHEIAPQCKNTNKCYYKKCQFSHNSDNFNESTFEVEEDESKEEDNNLENNSVEKAVRCDYGYCDLQQNVYFKTRSDLKIHLRCQHGNE